MTSLTQQAFDPLPLFPQVTPLFLACRLRAWDSALLLLSRGADPNKTARSKGEVLSPLLFAAGFGSKKVCRRLLAAGARQDLDTGGIELDKEKPSKNTF